MKNPWEKIDSPSKDVNVLRVSETHPLAMYWGRDIKGNYLFIYETQDKVDTGGKKLPKLEGIGVFTRNHANMFRLILQLNDKSDWELFYSLCMDLIKCSADLPEGRIPYFVIIRRLTRWQSFLKRRRTDMLSAEEIKGLIGELLLMEEKISVVFGWEQAVLFWKGPEGAPQDFLIHDIVIEVKCQTGGSKPSIRISSAEQLIPQVSKGYLAVYTIVTSDCNDLSSFSLNDLVARIYNKMENETQETRDRFDELLGLVRYIHREEYEDTRYKKLNLICFELKDDFPRILLSDIKPGVEKVSYSIKLEACKQFISKPEWWE